jgi:hypothetical protein
MNEAALSRIVYTTSARGLSPRQTPNEEKEQRDIMSVALAQPHRGGSSDPRLATPLGRFVETSWPRTDRLYFACYRAGCDYAQEISAAKTARGFQVEGCGGEQVRQSALPEFPTLAQIAAQRAVIAELDRVVARANETLAAVHNRLPKAMERLCCTFGEPFPSDVGMLKNGLYRLAGHYGLLDRGINGLHPY